MRLTLLLLIGLSVTTLVGTATYYARKFEGRRTSSGEIFRSSLLTAASNRYPLGTKVRVINLKNNKEVTVRINDRMGNKHRLIDLSPAAAKLIGFYGDGMTKVKVEEI